MEINFERSYLTSRKKPVQDILTETGSRTNHSFSPFPPISCWGSPLAEHIGSQKFPKSISAVQAGEPWGRKQAGEGWRREANGIHPAEGLGDICGQDHSLHPLPFLSSPPVGSALSNLAQSFWSFPVHKRVKIYISFPHNYPPPSKFKKESGFEHQAGKVTGKGNTPLAHTRSQNPAFLLERHFLNSHISPGFGWKQGNRQNINLIEKMNPRVRFKSQEKGALYGIGDHDSHLRQDMEVEKEAQLEHTHHVNPPLLSAHRGRSILNAFCKQHNAKELHWQQKKELAGCS